MPLDKESPRPLSRQLADLLRAEIQDGTRPRGSRLPTIHKLAEEHDIATGTVTKALRILRSEGWIVGYSGSGTSVAEELPR